MIENNQPLIRINFGFYKITFVLFIGEKVVQELEFLFADSVLAAAQDVSLDLNNARSLLRLVAVE